MNTLENTLDNTLESTALKEDWRRSCCLCAKDERLGRSGQPGE